MPNKLTRGEEISARILIIAMEIPPAAYVAVTGHVPNWIRVWMSVWLIFWTLSTVISSIKAQVKQ